jgi:ABC-type Fe3+ transport system permease subunit
LLLKSVLMSAAGATVAMVLSIPAMSVIGTGRAGRWPAVATALLIGPLLFPPTVLAFGWDKLTGGSTWMAQQLRIGGVEALTRGSFRAAWVWGSWLWPVSAMVVSAGVRQWGRRAYEAAILDASPLQAVVRAVLRVLRPYVLAAWVLLFCICLTDYQIPHACSEMVYATELLSWLTESGRSIDGVWPALPMIAIVVPLLILLSGRIGLLRDAIEFHEGGTARRGGGWGWVALAGLVAVTAVCPMVALAMGTELTAAMGQAYRVYWSDLWQTIGVAAVGAVGCVILGEALMSAGRWSRPAVWGVVLGGLLPGALVGQALVAGYVRVPAVYDQWWMMSLTYVGRFGWIGLLASWLASRSVPRMLVEQAAVDGAGQDAQYWWVRWPIVWRVIVAGGAAALAMSVSEISAISMTRTPGVGTISLTLIEKFHRFEDEMLVSLSLWLALIPLPAIGLVAWAMKERRRAA